MITEYGVNEKAIDYRFAENSDVPKCYEQADSILSPLTVTVVFYKHIDKEQQRVSTDIDASPNLVLITIISTH